LRKFFAPEVVQSSNMDCGPASLKCLLEGFGVRASYGRLREACQTGVDGASIDVMEQVANQLGLEAEQIMLPADHLFLRGSHTLPAIVVVRLASGLTHFVVAWRRHGSLLQVMDPAVGRRWPTSAQFAREVFSHTMPAPAADWRDYAASDDFQTALDERLTDLGVSSTAGKSMRASALKDPAWRGIAALDAAVRLLTALERTGGVRSSRDSLRLLERLCANPELIPSRYWSVRPGPPGPDDQEQVLMTGAVLVRVRRKRSDAVAQPLLPELAAALEERPVSAARELLRSVREAGWLSALVLVAALAIGAGGVLVEAVLFRGLFDIAAGLHLAGQRLGAVAAIVLFSSALLLFDVPLLAGVVRLGRQLENRFRLAFFAKIPRITDRYFHSRLISDMAERGHVIHRLRNLPDQVRQALQCVFGLCATAAGIIWLAPGAAPLVLLTVAVALLPAFLSQPALIERELRVRSHLGALTRFYLDAMLGLVPIRTHGAQRSVRREHEKLLGEWAHASLRLQRTVIGIEALQLTAMFSLVAALLLSHPLHGPDIGRALLVVYWALNLPVLGQDFAALARQLPNHRNTVIRLLEPLGAPEESMTPLDAAAIASAPSIEFRDVAVEASGHTILEDIRLRIEPGEHVAIVGPSGAGKSSLAGVLLGWLNPSRGAILVDDRPLACDRLRAETAWVDPAVQLWNRSLLANLTYGSRPTPARLGRAIDLALLRGVLENLPEGMQSKLGEGGALVSGGEGQRVRLARAVLRSGVRLVILDEPFRGLDREKRHQLLRSARQLWRDCTMLCITHDIEETQDFDRVLVIEHGRVIENGPPEQLCASTNSRYAQLLEAEAQTRSGLWSGAAWRRIRIHSGRVLEDALEPVPTDLPQEDLSQKDLPHREVA
jgi:ABC-type bacteriocin/lantibiotic exporter with double-glycine peptidase domain